MRKCRFLTCAMAALAFSFGAGVCGADIPVIGSAPVAEAEQYWCHNDGTYDYYVDTDCKSGTRSGLKYIGVVRSDGQEYHYCFSDYQNVWTYNYAYGRNSFKFVYHDFQKVSSSQLANDILYATLQVW